MTKEKSNELPRGTYYMADPDELVIIGLDTADGPEHPLYDVRIKKPLDEAKVRNFRTYGVIKPITAKRDGVKLIVVDGRGRTRYARAVKALQAAAGEETIRVPVMIKKGDDAHLFGVSRAANLHDADGPITTAKNAQRLIDMGKSVDEVADTFGVTTQTIRNWQAMLDLAPEVIQATIDAEVSTTAAIQLAPLPHAQQVELLSEIKEEAKAGVKPTVERTKRKVAEKAGKTASKTPKERIESARNLLVKYTGIASPTKEDMAGTIERVCRVLLSHGLDKLATDEE